MLKLCDVVALLAGQSTCDSEVVGSSPGWAPLRSGLGQATYTCVPLSPSSIISYQPRGFDLFGWESNRTGGQYPVMAVYQRVHS